MKWKENRNANVQMITVVTCEGTKTGEDAMNQGNKIYQWVGKATEPQPLFDPRKEKEMYM
jgi:hypothetical protein